MVVDVELELIGEIIPLAFQVHNRPPPLVDFYHSYNSNMPCRTGYGNKAGSIRRFENRSSSPNKAPSQYVENETYRSKCQSFQSFSGMGQKGIEHINILS